MAVQTSETSGNPPGYACEEEYRRDLFELVSIYLCQATVLKRETIARQGERNLFGSYMGAEEAARYIAGYPSSAGPIEGDTAQYLISAERRIAARLLCTPNRGEDFRLERLRLLFHMSPFDFFCVVCALSCEVDRGFEQLFVMLHNDTVQRRPTLGAVQSLYLLAHADNAPEDLSLLLPGSRGHWLLFCEAQPSSMATLPLALRPQVAAWLMGYGALGSELGRHCRVIDCDPQTDRPPMFLSRQLADARFAALESLGRREGRITLLCGPDGSGKRRTLECLAQEKTARFLLVEIDPLLSAHTPESLLPDLILPVLLDGYLLAFENIDADFHRLQGTVHRLLSLLAPDRPGIFLLFDELRGSICGEGYLVTRIDYPYPDHEQSLCFWRSFSQGLLLDDGIRFETLCAKYRLTPGQIQTALRSAAAQADAQGAAIDSAGISRAVLLNHSSRLCELADAITPAYTWDDLVLDDATAEMLRCVCSRIQYRYKVENEWRFHTQSSYGNGLSVLLFGPSGTGKTMSAQVIANELLLPLYRVDVSQLISKYIGETAKNLDAIFTEAKASNVILFFDEADSLFSSRTEVKTSNDRYANTDVSYLLQRIEDYSGISILATNLAHNFDEAFRRRIRFIINIPLPDPRQRLQIWQKAFGFGASLDPQVDLKLLADQLEISGSVIKSAAEQAAYFAAAENAGIDMRRIVRALRMELAKLGKPEPHFMQSFR